MLATQQDQCCRTVPPVPDSPHDFCGCEPTFEEQDSEVTGMRAVAASAMLSVCVVLRLRGRQWEGRKLLCGIGMLFASRSRDSRSDDLGARVT